MKVAICAHLDQICVNAPEQVARAGHPIISSLEPGADWSWCYVDEVAFRAESDQFGSGG